MFYLFVAILSGAMISVQSSSNGILYPFLGVIGVSCVSQTLNALCTFLYRVITTKHLPKFKKMPLYCYLGGLCAIFVLGITGYLVSHLGTAVTVCLSVSGQLFTSAVCDHFGFFSDTRTRFRAVRVPGFLCILAGVFIINFTGASSFTGIESRASLALLLLLALSAGCVVVFARLFNYESSKYVGKLDGNIINAGGGALVALVIWLITCGGRLPVAGFRAAPLYAFATGPLGFGNCVLSMVAYEKLKVFHATIFLLIGQIAASIIADLIFYGSFPPGKLLGILVICIGIALDKKFSR